MFATWVGISRGAVAEGSKAADFMWIHFLFLVSGVWILDSGFGIVDSRIGFLVDDIWFLVSGFCL